MSFLQVTARKVANNLGRESWLINRLRPAYENLLDWASGGKGIPWNINGVSYRIDPHFRHQLGENYDAPVAEFLRQHVKPGAICFDVGANVGVYVLQFAYWSAPNGKVIAFEPNPTAREILQKHININQLGDRAQVVGAAVSANTGEALFYAADADGMSRLGEPNQAIADRVREIRVPVITLDEYCQTNNIEPDWLFIDIEGFEFSALAGAQKLIKRSKNRLGIVVEMHPNVWQSANTSRQEAESMLKEFSLKALPLTGQSDPLNDHGLVHLAYL